MKAIRFKEANHYYAENQEDYETLPVKADFEAPETPVTMCFQLTKEERKQVADTGNIWLTILTFHQPFHPIKMSCLKPEDCTEPERLRRYYIYKRESRFIVYRSKSKSKVRGELYGEFLGRKTARPITSKGYASDFEEGTIGSMYDGTHIEVVTLNYIIT